MGRSRRAIASLPRSRSSRALTTPMGAASGCVGCSTALVAVPAVCCRAFAARFLSRSFSRCRAFLCASRSPCPASPASPTSPACPAFPAVTSAVGPSEGSRACCRRASATCAAISRFRASSESATPIAALAAILFVAAGTVLRSFGGAGEPPVAIRSVERATAASLTAAPIFRCSARSASLRSASCGVASASAASISSGVMPTVISQRAMASGSRSSVCARSARARSSSSSC